MSTIPQSIPEIGTMQTTVLLKLKDIYENYCSGIYVIQFGVHFCPN